ncbi:MAG: hypothetical protein KC910_17170 [Candidatus Eremiobacteraeota bacterium]|nr:hypothetical protein [Candidatus Eremiobacteraeota bacterium]
MAQPAYSGPTQTNPGNSPDAYRSLPDGTTTHYNTQANGLTPGRSFNLDGKTRVLQANQQFFDHWKSVADANPVYDTPPAMFGGMSLNLPAQPPNHYAKTQLESPEIRVLAPSDQNRVKVENGQLTGDQAVIDTFVTAEQVHDSATSRLGREVSYRSPDGKLSVHLDAPGVADAAYRPGTGAIAFSKDQSVGDPDVVAHEQGHALMDAVRPNLTSRDTRTTATGEAFADGQALIHSLDDPEVRKDLLAHWDKGEKSSLASNIGEGNNQAFAKLGDDPAPGVREGIRDLGAGPPTKVDPQDDGHEASRHFGSGLYDSLHDVYQGIRKAHPDMSPDAALEKARDTVGNDLTRALDFMHNGNATSQEELAEAMMKAGRVDGQGANQDAYLRNFKANGVEVTGEGVGANQQRLDQLNANEALHLPAAVAGQDYELKPAPMRDSGRKDEHGLPIWESDPPETTAGSRAANEYLAKNAAALGIPPLTAQRIYHNDRGETFIQAGQVPLGANGAVPAGMLRSAVLGFDKAGQLIHFDSRQDESRQPYMPNIPGLPNGGPATPGGFPGGFPGGPLFGGTDFGSH